MISMISRPLAVPFTRGAFKNDKLQKYFAWPTTCILGPHPTFPHSQPSSDQRSSKHTFPRVLSVWPSTGCINSFSSKLLYKYFVMNPTALGLGRAGKE